MKIAHIINAIFFALCIILYPEAEISFAGENGVSKVIAWDDVSPLNFTIGYTSFSEYGGRIPDFIFEKEQIEKMSLFTFCGIRGKA